MLGKILRYAERCMAQRVVKVQSLIVGDAWTDTNNSFSLSCEDFHIKKLISCLPGSCEFFVDDSVHQNRK